MPKEARMFCGGVLGGIVGFMVVCFSRAFPGFIQTIPLDFLIPIIVFGIIGSVSGLYLFKD